ADRRCWPELVPRSVSCQLFGLFPCPVDRLAGWETSSLRTLHGSRTASGSSTPGTRTCMLPEVTEAKPASYWRWPVALGGRAFPLTVSAYDSPSPIIPP